MDETSLLLQRYERERGRKISLTTDRVLQVLSPGSEEAMKDACGVRREGASSIYPQILAIWDASSPLL